MAETDRTIFHGGRLDASFEFTTLANGIYTEAIIKEGYGTALP